MIEIKLGAIYTEEDLHDLYHQQKQAGYLQKWKFGCTVDGFFFHIFNINRNDSEFWCIGENTYQCTKTNDESLEEGKERFYTVGVMPTDRTKSTNYYTRYRGNTKEKWNPVSTIGGTGRKE